MGDSYFLLNIVSQIVDSPDDVAVEQTTDERGVLFMLTVNPLDMGRVIGHRGETATALRTIVRAFGQKQNARYSLKIAEGGRR